MWGRFGSPPFRPLSHTYEKHTILYNRLGSFSASIGFSWIHRSGRQNSKRITSMTLQEVKQKYQIEYAKPVWLLNIVNNLPILDVEKDWAWQEELQKEERIDLEEAANDRLLDK